MKPVTNLTPRFVDGIPRILEAGILYICEEYATASHTCACGCGMRVATPLTVTDWKVIREGDGSISLFPSIGNWNYPCQSHYWIRHNRIVWAPKWSEEEIVAGRELDRERRAEYYRDLARPKRNALSRCLAWLKALFR